MSIQDLSVYRKSFSRVCSRLLTVCALCVAGTSAAADSAPDFNRDIRKILSNNCFQCHGPDAETREAGLRLDTFEGATGEDAIVPGDAAASLVMQRIQSTDPDERMPPPETGKRLTAEEIARLGAWIDSGAAYTPHWSFVPPERPAMPSVSDPSWPRNGIDPLVMARLDAEGLAPSPVADRNTLIRRVSLDLTGLPPTPEEVAAFLADDRPNAYEALVDRLLASPRYGERWARLWLDMARYADTKGYEADRDRPMWPYRDWVIEAFNRDLPFDQFTVEQIAGDLLPNPTEEQILATAFHRNTMTNDEGGTDDEEFRNAAVVDRVNTTMEVWMGMTMACAQCHTHKYDPITQTEYYEFFSILNQTEDADLNSEAPLRPVLNAEQREQVDNLQRDTQTLREELHTAAAEMHDAQVQWETVALEAMAQPVEFGPWHRIGPYPGEHARALFEAELPFEIAPELEKSYEEKYTYTVADDFVDGQVYALPEEKTHAHVFYREVKVAEAQDLTLLIGTDDRIRVRVNGALVLDKYTRKSVDDLRGVTVPLRPGKNALVIKVVSMGGPHALYFQREGFVPESLRSVLQTPTGDRTPEQRTALTDYFATQAPELLPLRKKIRKLESETNAVLAKAVQVPIMRELPDAAKRKTHIQIRGSYRDLGDEVQPGVPAVFHDLPEGTTPNRLDLAHWLVSRENPLTARVVANRFWEQFFGIGIVETGEDFGVQGAPPSHPELLDWLAVEFMDQGWSMKALCKTIVMSATYRQSSNVRLELYERDPYNRLLARGPRFRLEAEMVRDQALAVAGLLSDKLHGPPVMPYQPDGVWQVVYSGDQWKQSEGEDRFRRALYTYWRRTSPYPSMIAFDAPSREVCEVRRIRTNTPLQALVTLNDPVYVEAAQALARRIVADGGDSIAERINFAFECVLARRPSIRESVTIAELYGSEYAHYRSDIEAARMMATVPLGPLEEGADMAMLAAWTVVANVLLNLDEVMMKT